MNSAELKQKAIKTHDKFVKDMQNIADELKVNHLFLISYVINGENMNDLEKNYELEQATNSCDAMLRDLLDNGRF